MSKTITCDFCGRMYRYSTWKAKSRRGTMNPIPNRLLLRNVNPSNDIYTEIDSLDICVDCFNKFSQWVDDQRKLRMEELSLGTE